MLKFVIKCHQTLKYWLSIKQRTHGHIGTSPCVLKLATGLKHHLDALLMNKLVS